SRRLKSQPLSSPCLKPGASRSFSGENVSALRQTFLEQGPYGQLSADVLARIQRAVQVSIGIYEL
ncbi:hypothetical protein QUA00_35840, partial [Microcoleus sp. T2B6]